MGLPLLTPGTNKLYFQVSDMSQHLLMLHADYMSENVVRSFP